MVIMDSRLMLKMIKELNQIDQKEKSIEDAESQLSIQRDIEQQESKKQSLYRNQFMSRQKMLDTFDVSYTLNHIEKCDTNR